MIELFPQVSDVVHGPLVMVVFKDPRHTLLLFFQCSFTSNFHIKNLYDKNNHTETSNNTSKCEAESRETIW